MAVPIFASQNEGMRMGGWACEDGKDIHYADLHRNDDVAIKTQFIVNIECVKMFKCWKNVEHAVYNQPEKFLVFSTM